MRYFTRGWINGELTDDEAKRVAQAYAMRLEEIAPRLPPTVTHLYQDVDLHDCLIESVRWKPSVAELSLTLVAGGLQTGYETVNLIYRGAMLGPQRIDSLRNAAMDREASLLYDEIDIGNDGMLVHRLLFWPREEVTIDFRELEYACTPRSDRRVTLLGAFLEEDADDEG